MFSEKLDVTSNNAPLPPARAPGEKRKTARDQMMEDMVEYHKRPNAKRLQELRARCNKENIQFDQILNKAKEAMIK